MASHYFGVNIGSGLSPVGVASGTSLQSKDVQIVTLDGAGLTRAQVIMAIDALKAYMEKSSTVITA